MTKGNRCLQRDQLSVAAVHQEAAVVQDLPASDYHFQAASDAPGLEAVLEHLSEDQRTLQEESRLAEVAEVLIMVEACVQQLAAVVETAGWQYCTSKFSNTASTPSSQRRQQHQPRLQLVHTEV